MAFDLVVSGSVHRVDVDPQTPPPRVIRDLLMGMGDDRAASVQSANGDAIDQITGSASGICRTASTISLGADAVPGGSGTPKEDFHYGFD